MKNKSNYNQLRYLVQKKQYHILGNFFNFRDDELIEVTPKVIRIRKKELDSGIRRKKRRDEKSHN